MNVDIACYKGCGNSVIGQCNGYKDSCGQFYCLIHSKDKLCYQCASKKDANDRALEIYKRYISIARNLKDKSTFFLFANISTMIIGAITYFTNFYGSYNGYGDDPPLYVIATLIAITLVLMFIFTTLTQKFDKEFKTELNNLDIDNPGFKDFYATWRKDKNEKILVGIISMAILTTAGVAYSRSQKKDD
jgi:hypothetical protein